MVHGVDMHENMRNFFALLYRKRRTHDGARRRVLAAYPRHNRLSADAVKAIKGIFKLYDKDKSGTLTVNELKKALEKTGIEPDEIKSYFKEYDADGSNDIDLAEFERLMESTGAFDDM